ncbi:3,4-dihydroxy-2-butanone-4-phosphate synthase [Aliarcobacter butzleri]|uniref:3,4-dihydroxy-2-butanone-4-phosphate synthase n=1 Tax=Aliarcobacter butzleri TaxID=28197 RepID=UPI003B219B54
MNQQKNIETAIKALQNGTGIIITDDKNRENEADIIFHANTITEKQMALLIRECSGIVCLCLTPQKVKELNLPMMVQSNHSKFQTPFTISIEAKEDISTGVSAKDGGVLERNGHTEASIDMMKLSNLEPNAVLCEITNEDGSMAKGEEIINFAKKYSMPIISIEEIIKYRQNSEK